MRSDLSEFTEDVEILIGQYIETGLDWETLLDALETILAHQRIQRQESDNDFEE